MRLLPYKMHYNRFLKLHSRIFTIQDNNRSEIGVFSIDKRFISSFFTAGRLFVLPVHVQVLQSWAICSPASYHLPPCWHGHLLGEMQWLSVSSFSTFPAGHVHSPAIDPERTKQPFFISCISEVEKDS